MSPEQVRRRALVVLVSCGLLLVAWQYASHPNPANQYYVQIAGQRFAQNQGGIVKVPKRMWEDGCVRAHPVNVPKGGKITVERSSYIRDSFVHVNNFLLDAGTNIVSVRDQDGKLISRQDFKILASK